MKITTLFSPADVLKTQNPSFASLKKVLCLFAVLFVFSSTVNAQCLVPDDCDNDGVLNVNDLDDDNDGILDTVEVQCIQFDNAITQTNTTTVNPDNALGPISLEGTAANNTNTASLGNGDQLILTLPVEVPAGGVVTLSLAKNNANGILTVTDEGTGSFVFNHGVEDILGRYSFTVTVPTDVLTFTRDLGGVRVDGVEYCTNYSDDFDGDNIIDQYDTDSDGDGCPDAVEATGSIVPGDLTTDNNLCNSPTGGCVDGDGLPLNAGLPQLLGGSQDASVQSLLCDCADPDKYAENCDLDGDGINNSDDLDDDNDGILDSVECFGDNSNSIITVEGFETYVEQAAWPGGTSSDGSLYWNAQGTIEIIEGLDGIPFGGGVAYQVNQYSEANLPGDDTYHGFHVSEGLSTLYDDLVIGNTYYVDFYYINSGRETNEQEPFQMNLYIDGNLEYTGPTIEYDPDTWYRVSSSFIATETIHDIQFGITQTTPLVGVGNSGVGIDGIVISTTPTAVCPDTDGDGIIDSYDLDSDGDGCSDSFEAGAITGEVTDHQFAITPDTNNDGLNDTIDADLDGVPDYIMQPYAYSSNISLCSDFDMDGVLDIDDVDDDNDGILDSVESPGCFYEEDEIAQGNRQAYINVTTELELHGTTGNNLNNTIDGYTVNAPDNNTLFVAQSVVDLVILQYDFPNPVEITEIQFPLNSSNSSFSNNFNAILQGSNDEVTWTDLTASVNYPATTTGSTVNIVPTTTGEYRFYRWLGVTGNVRSNGKIAEAIFVLDNYVPSLHPTQSCSDNLDGTEGNNHQDLDSDGDGCSDSYEAGVIATETANHEYPSTPDANSDGLNDDIDPDLDGIPNFTMLPYAYANNLNLCGDFDMDGVSDLDDVDDDNDGIYDAIESPNCFLQESFFTSGDRSPYVNVTSDLTPFSGGGFSIDNVIDGETVVNPDDVLTFHFGQDVTDNSIFEFEFIAPIELTNINFDLSAVWSFMNGASAILQGSNDASSWTDLTANTVYPNSESTTEVSIDITQNQGNYKYYRLFGTSGLASSTGIILETYFTLAPGFVDSLNPLPNCYDDFDDDNANNHLDTDSDGDTCPDAIEGDGGFLETDLTTDDNFCNTSSPVCVDATGLPTIAGTPQDVGSSQDASISSLNCTTTCEIDFTNVTTSSTNITSCVPGDNGTITIGNGGLNASTAYIVSYVKDGGTPVTISPNPTSNASSEIIITDLEAGTYTEIIVTSTSDASCTETTVTGGDTIVITEFVNTSFASGASATDETGIGEDDGILSAAPSGGSGTYSFSWDQTVPSNIVGLYNTQSVTGVSPGTYQLTVTDTVTGCTVTESVIVGEFDCGTAVVIDSVTPTAIGCKGESTGSATAAVTALNTPLTYVWTNSSAVVVGGNSATLSNQPTGVYTVKVTDSKGCFSESTVTISEPSAALSGSATTTTHQTTVSGTEGEVTVTPSDGTAPYSYSWNSVPAQTTQTATGLAPGDYEVTITDSNGCTAVATTTVNSLNCSVGVTVDGTGNVLCNGASTGTIDITVTNGTTPSFAWTGPNGYTSTSEDLTGLAAGNYSLTVTNADGCETSTTAIITEPSALDVSISQDPVACKGDASGSLDLSASGGVAPYSFAWTGTGVTATAEDQSGLAAGTYNVTVTDDNGCTFTTSKEITEPANALVANASSTDETAVNADDGTVTAAPTGGTVGSAADYQYSWDQTVPSSIIGLYNTQSVTGVSPGTYQVTITDLNGCTVTQSVIVGEFDCGTAVVIDSVTPTGAGCKGESTGSATVAVTATNTPLTYVWTDSSATVVGGNSATIVNQPTGVYTVKVTDSKGCFSESTVTIGEPSAALSGSATTTTHQLSVSGTEGEVTVTPSGGTAPYSYSWNSAPAQTTQTATGLAPGDYEVTITDANGCTAVATTTVNSLNCSVGVTLDGTGNVLCNGASTGTIDITVTNGTTPSFAWTGPNGYTATSEDLTGLAAGNYSLTITNGDGCETSTTAIITEPSALDVSISQNPVACKGDASGSLDLSASGGVAPYSFAWTGTGVTATAEDQSGLAAGTYNVTVTDDNGCTFTTSKEITEPTNALVANASSTDETAVDADDGTVTAAPTGGTVGSAADYSYSWDQTAPTSIVGLYNTQSVAAVSPGTYQVTITDLNGCTVTQSVIVDEFDCGTAVVIDSVTPTGAGCKGESTGSATVAVTAANTPLIYVWTDSSATVVGGNSATIVNQPTGVYTVKVTDSKGCFSESTVTIGEPSAALSGSATTTTHQLSVSGTEGEVTVTPSGGTATYSYSWNSVPVQTTQTATGLAPGDYEVTITDANGCTAVATTTVNSLNCSVGVTLDGTGNVLCNGESTGTIDITVTNGTTPSFAWTGPNSYTSTSEDLTGLAAGTYSLTITNGDGCETSTTATITEPSALDVSISQNPVACKGDASGSLDLSASGGVAPYRFAWTGTGVTATAEDQSGLVAGTYNVTVTDDNGCTFTTSKEITEPTSALVANASSTGETAVDADDGILTAAPSGGTVGSAADYSYSWDQTAPNSIVGLYNTQSVTGVSPGTYQVTITDLNGCTVVESVILLSDPCSTDTIPAVTDPYYTTWSVADCDGDGEDNVTEVGNGTDPFDPCSVTAETIPDVSDPNYAIWAAADCDGDTEENGTEVDFGTDPFDPCSVTGTSIPAVTDSNYAIWAAADCDGDNEDNGTEVGNGTDPFDPCSVTVETIPAITDSNYAIWAAADCDGDEEDNGTEVGNGTDPFDPCSVTAETIPALTNPNYAIWSAADCDGDGENNGTETNNGTDPFDSCSVTVETIPASTDVNYAIWAAADCDGDEEDNGTEVGNGTDPFDACSVTAETIPPITNPNYATWAAADCDGDGENNGDENDNGTSPFDPCEGGALVNIDLTDTTSDWYLADCDGDGTTNGVELDPNGDGTSGPNGTNPNDPCSVNTQVEQTNPLLAADDPIQVAYEIWAASDCDGDGVTNGLEAENGTIFTNPCSFNAADITGTVTAITDCDGDGEDNTTDPDDGNACEGGTLASIDLTDTTSDWYTADCDGDGTINGVEVDPDGDGTTEPFSTDPNDPCSVLNPTEQTDPMLAADDPIQVAYEIWAAADCDGDGVTNGLEAENGTIFTNPCSFNAADITGTVTAITDCDGDGEDNTTDPDDGNACEGGTLASIDLTDTTSDWYTADCDGDGTINGVEVDPDGDGTTEPFSTDPNDPCSVLNPTEQTDPMLAADDPIQVAYEIWAASDCDGDGVTNGLEAENGTIFTNPCSFNAADITGTVTAITDCDGDGEDNTTDPDDGNACEGGTLASIDLTDTTSDWYTADCDGDGTINGVEVDPDGDGTTEPFSTDPNDPCSVLNPTEQTDPMLAADDPIQVAYEIWAASDCDGDGVTNELEAENGTSFTNPCSFNAADITETVTVITDCDGDGEDNTTDPDDTNPCEGGSLPNVDLTDTNSDWYTADCDGDGVINGIEFDPNMDGIPGPNNTNPNDGCDYDPDDVTIAQSAVWNDLDCDGDGVTNGQEVIDGTDPTEMCDFVTANQTETTSTDFNAADCDGDGVTNGQEVIDGTDVQDSCELIAANQDTTPSTTWINSDCDEDGVTNGDEIIDGTDPTNGCELMLENASVPQTPAWEALDCDGDGVTNGTELMDGTDPLDACELDYTHTDATATTVWNDADCDGDGVTNGQEVIDGTDPTEMCDFVTANQSLPTSSDFNAADCDGDGVTNGQETIDGTDVQDACELVAANQDTTPSTTWVEGDCDGDGVTNGFEIIDGTDPTNECEFMLENANLPQTPVWEALDCDGDGVTNGTELMDGTDPLNPCELDYTHTDATATTVWNDADCDGDGVTNGQEVIDGTDPTEICDLVPANQTLPTSTDFNAADCDGDGVTNGQEVLDGTDIQNECELVAANQDTTPSTTWVDGDCDGDGVTNGFEIIDGTDPTNGCEFMLENANLPQTPAWEALDCDGDGVTNATELTDGTDPLNACEFDYTHIDSTPTTAWSNSDCDGDGVTNGQEIIDGTDPNVLCDFEIASQTLPTSGDFSNADCDGDGVSNGQEVTDGTDVLNPCDLVATNQDTTPSETWVDGDCDGDGVTNGDEVIAGTNPTDPCEFILDDVSGPQTPAWNALDCDGDGVTNGTEVADETDPLNTCDLVTTSQDTTPTTNWNNADCDGDGVTNGTEILDGTDITNSCDFVIVSQTLPTSGEFANADCDGDGVTNGTEVLDGTNPNDSCDYVTTSQTLPQSDDWNTADCDGDGVTNGQEVIDGTDSQNPCDFVPENQDTTSTSSEYDALDCDGDGVTNGNEIIDGTNPLDLCDLVLASQTETPTDIWLDADCDGDGVTNGTEIIDFTDPLDLCNSIVTSITIDPSLRWQDIDCDGDGVTNGQEIIDGTDPYNPCDYVLASQTQPTSDEWNNGDCDGDGVLDGTEILDGTNPNDACDFNYENQDVTLVSDNWLASDCDCDGAGDGFTNAEELADNNNNGIPDYAECNNGDTNAEDGINIFDIMTPNGDGNNDVFVISGLENYPNNTVRIYNRWGVEVYNVDGYGINNKFFKGESEGRVTIKKEEKLPVGTYYYILTYENNQGNSVQKAGPLYINRK